MVMKMKFVKSVAKIMLGVMIVELVAPTTQALALTSGPSQPEVQSFEPVGTTDMVDIFSGDFVYNIPLLDVEGYPINIAYHSGTGIEDEASWVGLGWNINPGQINRSVRGIPDDFNGESLVKRLHINEEREYRFKTGLSVGFEVVGAVNLGFSSGYTVSYNNYKGLGIGKDFGANISVPVLFGSPGIGVNVSAHSQEGADIDGSLSFKFSNTKLESEGPYLSISGGTGYNSRRGLKNISFGVEVGKEAVGKKASLEKASRESTGGIGFGSSIPIGLQNYVPVITNSSQFNAFQFSMQFGLEAAFTFPHFYSSMSISKLTYDPIGDRKSYGYMYSENADEYSILDFSREKDGIYNKHHATLPLSSMTYDVFGINGQGTGGMFRPFRGDFGYVYDPKTISTTSNQSVNAEAGGPIGPVGGLLELGANYSTMDALVESGPWHLNEFQKNIPTQFFEKVYFKQGGEMTYSNIQDHPLLASHSPIYMKNRVVHTKEGNSSGSIPLWAGNTPLYNRNPRSNFISHLTNKEVSIYGVSHNSMKTSFPISTFINTIGQVKHHQRFYTKTDKAKAHHIGEITQLLPDGRRYVYGLPAMNNMQRESTFSVDYTNAGNVNGLVKFTEQQDGMNNDVGNEKYFQSTYTPAYAYSYLLTEVLSPNYMDITGDGLTEDDLGTYTKFNYSMSDSDYRWVTPYSYGAIGGTLDSAMYNPGYLSDNLDDKGSYIIGSKETWYLHSVESKNQVAEFYISERTDAKGIKQKVVKESGNELDNVSTKLTQTKTGNSVSYKLDSIVLYNKHDRFVNEAAAVPIKTVVFQYDYSLCPNTPNSSASGKGKLTLKKIYFKYGNSSKSLLNPYVFTYSAQNQPYDVAAKDRWGNYNPNNQIEMSNYEFPYVRQDKTQADLNANNWHLTKVKLPSGGELNIEYESDDYSFVQDKRTMEMFKIEGVGSSEAFEPRNELYRNIDHCNDYVYFKRDLIREIPEKSLRDNYLEGTDLLSFSINIDISGKNKYEHVKGYAKVESVGICPNDSDYGYIKLKKEKAGDKNGKMINALTIAGLNYGRFHLPHIIYPGFKDENGQSMRKILEGLIAASDEMKSIFQNVNISFMKKGLSKKININKSWVRLHTAYSRHD